MKEVLPSRSHCPALINLKIILSLACAVTTHCRATETANVPSVGIVVDQPVYAGEPVWVRLTGGPWESVRYPFSASLEDTGCNLLELKQNGKTIPPYATHSPIVRAGPACGSAAPPGSPGHRLPLHVLYPLDTPGTYSLRWTIRSFSPGGLRDQAISEWLTFTVRPASPNHREEWLKQMLSNPPSDDGQLTGDYLPSLLAAAPDPRVTNVFIRYLHSARMVAGIASSCLERLPEPDIRHALAEAIQRFGPSEQLAYLTSNHTGWTLDDENKFVQASLLYLKAEPTPLVARRAGYSSFGTKTTAAIQLFIFMFYLSNHTWPENPTLARLADQRVLQAAPVLMSEANDRTVQLLAEYLGSMPPNPTAHELLTKMAERTDHVAVTARLCLMWHPQPSDIPLIATALTSPGDQDKYGTERSALVSALVTKFGDQALPFLENAISKSPYLWVRVESAKQLAIRDRPLGFKFLLDALETNQFYKAEMVSWLKDTFPNVLRNDTTEQEITVFLRLRSKRGPRAGGNTHTDGSLYSRRAREPLRM